MPPSFPVVWVMVSRRILFGVWSECGSVSVSGVFECEGKRRASSRKQVAMGGLSKTKNRKRRKLGMKGKDLRRKTGGSVFFCGRSGGQ